VPKHPLGMVSRLGGKADGSESPHVLALPTRSAATIRTNESSWPLLLGKTERPLNGSSASGLSAANRLALAVRRTTFTSTQPFDVHVIHGEQRASADASAGLEALVSTRLASG
jgi:hypothetical protein